MTDKRKQSPTAAEMGQRGDAKKKAAGGRRSAQRNRTARALADALLAYVGNHANAERAALLPLDVLAALAAYRAACGK